MLPSTVYCVCCQLSGEARTVCRGTDCSRSGSARNGLQGQCVCWNTVFSSTAAAAAAAAAVQLQYSRNIVLLCGRFPRPALNFTLNSLPLVPLSLSLSPPQPQPQPRSTSAVSLRRVTEVRAARSHSSGDKRCSGGRGERERERGREGGREFPSQEYRQAYARSTWTEHLVPCLCNDWGGLELGATDAVRKFTDCLGGKK